RNDPPLCPAPASRTTRLSAARAESDIGYELPLRLAEVDQNAILDAVDGQILDKEDTRAEIRLQSGFRVFPGFVRRTDIGHGAIAVDIVVARIVLRIPVCESERMPVDVQAAEVGARRICVSGIATERLRQLAVVRIVPEVAVEAPVGQR